MLFRRLNWNIVGWFRIVSTISYLVIALGFGAMIYHGFQGGQGFQPSHMLRLGPLVHRRHRHRRDSSTQPTTTDAGQARRSRRSGLTEESRHDGGQRRQRLRHPDADRVCQRFGAAVGRAQHRRAGRSRAPRRLRRSARRSAASTCVNALLGAASSRSASSSSTSRSGSAGTTSSAWSPSSRSFATRP